MIPSDHDRRFQLALGYQIIERQSKLVAFSIAQPANTRGQTLEFHSLLRHGDPALQMFVLGKHFQDQLVSSSNIRSLTRKCRPPKRSFALAEQWANVSRNEAGEVVGVLHACLVGKGPNVVAV